MIICKFHKLLHSRVFFEFIFNKLHYHAVKETIFPREPFIPRLWPCGGLFSHLLCLVRKHLGTWALRRAFCNTAQLGVSMKSEPSEQRSPACQADRMGRGSRQGRMIGLKVRMKWDKWGTLLHFAQETVLSKRPGFNVLHFGFSRGSLSLRECRQLQFLPEEDSPWLVPLAASSARKAGPTQAGAPCV